MENHSIQLNNVGFVAIGRNEGDRLKVALRAIQKNYGNSPIVYVDSGSSDDSVAFAQSLGIQTVELDLSIPFTAARARNAGAEVLLEHTPQLEMIQFLDGDCEVLAGWIESGIQQLNQQQNITIVSGRRAERYPDASIYNTLMDMEWNSPIGESLGVPGDMLIEVETFKQLSGFNETLIAGEDFDLCIRARKQGLLVYRVDAPMSMHDANIDRFYQWYQRTKRGGHAYANLYHIHGHTGAKHFRRKIFSIAFWGAAAPLFTSISAFFAPTACLIFLALFSAMLLKTTVKKLREGNSFRISASYSALVYIAKFPELLGFYEYWKKLFSNQRHTLIEYK